MQSSSSHGPRSRFAGRRAALGLLGATAATLLTGCEGSLQQWAAAQYLKLTLRPDTPLDEFARSYSQRTYPAPAGPPPGLKESAEIRTSQVAGNMVYTLTPRQHVAPWHIVYTHGGAFINPLGAAHWDIIESLITAVGATVTVPIYPLAPEHQYNETFALLEHIYRNLLANGPAQRLVLCGDSAGGNLALAQALYFKQINLPLPGRIVLFSPWLDLTMSNPAAKAIEPRDIMLRVRTLQQAGRWWSGTTDPANAKLSPINGDLRGLPPVDIYQGTNDLFLPDARRLQQMISAVGGTVSLHETPGGFHVFMGATFTPEAKRVYRQLAIDLAR
jgi:epsilon-lactone hydrolase